MRLISACLCVTFFWTCHKDPLFATVPVVCGSSSVDGRSLLDFAVILPMEQGTALYLVPLVAEHPDTSKGSAGI